MIPLSSSLIQLIEHLAHHGIKAIIVGGYVRDFLSGYSTEDLDIELYGITSLDKLEALLSPFGKVGIYGKSFGILKLVFDGYSIDFSPPRTESKYGTGHKGFEMAWHREMDYASAARRRDFTINSIGYDPLTQTLIDPYGGIKDLKHKILRCVDPQTFIDDPLRVLRAVQFAARFELTCDDTLLSLCQSMIADGSLEELPKERIFEELKKLFIKSAHPSIGMKLLKEMGGLSFFTPLECFEHTPQDPLSHPEGSVWTHTLMALDFMATLRSGEWRKDMVLMLSVLLHDIGKPVTTITINNVLNAPKHAEIGVNIARTWLNKITEDKALIASILPLIYYHGWPRKFYRRKASNSDILHLSTKVCIEDLILLSKADFFGRSFNEANPQTFDAGDWLYRCADTLNVLKKPPLPLLYGRDLIALGLTPSHRFKSILNNAYKAQLDQVFETRTQALEWLKKHLVTDL